MNPEWHFGFNDNSPFEWATTTGYFLTAALCGFAARRTRPETRDAASTWLMVAAGMVLLGINKQLDLQKWLIITGRNITTEFGIYHHKVAIRTAFLVVLAVGTGAVAFTCRHPHLTTLRRHPALLTGLGTLTIFIVLSSLHSKHLERLEPFPLARPEWHWPLEIGGLLLVACSAGAARSR